MRSWTGRRFTFSVAGLVVAAAPFAAAWAAPADPSGTWLTEDKRARIRIEPCGRPASSICGYVVWLKSGRSSDGAMLVDEKNPDPKKTSRALLGHQLIMGLRPREDRYEGRIYNNEDGKSYNVSIWLDGPNDLKVKGCLVAFLCSTQDWTRTTDTLAGQLTGTTGTASGPTSDPEFASPTTASTSPAPRRDSKAKP